MHNLKQKAIKGVSWSFIDNIANSGITFLVGIVLARLLSPEEFGILGMIAVFIAVSNSIVDSGFSSALIRKVDIKNRDYNTVFYFNMVLGVILYILLYFSAPLISRFFNEPILIAVTRVMGLLLIINSFGIVQRTLLIKEVDFKTQTKVSLIASISSGVIGIGMAVAGYGVWSLVAQQVIRQLLNSIFLWVFNTWRPVFEFSKASFKELFGFGSKLLVSGIIDTLYSNIYYVVIGKYFSANELGLFTRAKQFSLFISGNLTSIVQKVSYPLLCNIQNESNDELLKKTYQRIIKATMLVTFSCMLGLAAVAKPLILLLIGEKWLPSIIFLQILCFAAMLYPLHAINLNMLMVKGRSDLFLKLEIIKKIIGIAPVVIGIFYGIEIMLIGSVIVSIIAYFLNSFYSSNLINYAAFDQIKDVLPTFLVALTVSFIVWTITLLKYSNGITLSFQFLTGGILSLSFYELLKLPEYIELKQIILSFIKK
ncbi:lipopolysaccharide biosynthesis protein [Polaribacter sp. IC073]|uniref:lipopolysaccharide biosynthesis protein n=1 Tax=Polaribacter sp. IC073 TaxID=2508540 RepID=UPI0011BEC9EE|nr:lipopolysaccharide biosynthesis protein [Polaribacter sp. IC073]TXD47751.1 lipopolysaccharide biosynthesis protein [Polaribacter sp. IC073]